MAAVVRSGGKSKIIRKSRWNTRSNNFPVIGEATCRIRLFELHSCHSGLKRPETTTEINLTCIWTKDDGRRQGEQAYFSYLMSPRSCRQKKRISLFKEELLYCLDEVSKLIWLAYVGFFVFKICSQSLPPLLVYGITIHPSTYYLLLSRRGSFSLSYMQNHSNLSSDGPHHWLRQKIARRLDKIAYLRIPLRPYYKHSNRITTWKGTASTTIMSTKLVKRMLQQQLEPSVVPKSKSRKRQKIETPADDATKRAHFLETRVFLVDRAMSKVGGDASARALQQRVTTTTKKKAVVMVGNSRASSSQTRLKLEPTFQKKRHAVEKKKDMLSKIAKMLQQRKKKAKSPVTNKAK